MPSLEAVGREEASVEPAPSTPTVPEIAEVERFDGHTFENYVRDLPRFAEDSATIREKYSGFDLAELERATEIIDDLFDEELAPLIEARLGSGDVEFETELADGSIGFEPMDASRPGVAVFRSALDTEGNTRAARLTFPPAEYPNIDLRLRELSWLRGAVALGRR